MLRFARLLCLAPWALACDPAADSGSEAPRLSSPPIAQGKADSPLGERPEIGVILTSHGDIDLPEEIEPYIKSAFQKNVGVPLPQWVREPLTEPAYLLSKQLVEAQYDAIGPTNYRANAQLQADALQAALYDANINAKVYLGYNFTWPFIDDALAAAQADGVQKLVVFNKGAQFSFATLGESIDEVEHYLDAHPEWPVSGVAVRQFSDDERFRGLLAEVIERDARATFPDVPTQDICLLVASHGLPMRMINDGDPAVDQMLDVVDDLKVRLPEFPLYHGFLNDDFFPGAEWVAPKGSVVAAEMRSVSCPAVLMDARLSFTTHHRATLYDLDVEAREILEEPDLQPDGTLHPLYQPARVVLAQQWDAEPAFAALLRDLTVEALAGQGDLIPLAVGHR